MCQLLAMNCNVPTDIIFSFEGFRRRGGLTDGHVDGFGIGFFKEKGIHLFHDDKPSAHSPIAELIKDYQIKSTNVIAHIRKATQGETALMNTHPFVRELWGEYWLFAHNGQLRHFNKPKGNYYQPVGTSDSEQAFCYLLEQLRIRFDEKPDDKTLFDAITELTHEIREYGLYNFVLSNGNFLIAHASTLLFYIIRQAPFGEAKLVDNDLEINFAEETTPIDRVAVITTLPLTGNEKWEQLSVNEIVMFKNGDIVYRNQADHVKYMSIGEGLDIARKAGVSD